MVQLAVAYGDAIESAWARNEPLTAFHLDKVNVIVNRINESLKVLEARSTLSIGDGG
jgi:hypothetical protein